MNAFGKLPHPPKSLKPVKAMLLQELMHLAVVVQLSTALLKTPDPVKTRILKLGRNSVLNLTTIDVGYKRTGSIQTTNVLLPT